MLVKPCFVHIRVFFMILLMTVCMMRESVAVALLVTDGSLDVIGDAWSLVVKVQKSKTDQVRAVHTIGGTFIYAQAYMPPILVHSFTIG